MVGKVACIREMRHATIIVFGKSECYRPLEEFRAGASNLFWQRSISVIAGRTCNNHNKWYKPYLLTYLLTPWCRVLLEKLAGLQLVKKFSAFYGTRRFITAFTSFRHPSLYWASPIQSTYPQPTS